MLPIQFNLAWSDPKDDSIWESTRGKLDVTLNGKTIWGKPGGIDSTWLHFLEHLTVSWPHLMEEGNPWHLECPIEDIFERGRKLWKKRPLAEQEAFEEELYDYLNYHDLGHGVQGMYVPQLFVTKEGLRFRWASIGQVAYTSTEDGIGVLRAIGNLIANRLKTIEGSDRADRTLLAWRKTF